MLKSNKQEPDYNDEIRRLIPINNLSPLFQDHLMYMAEIAMFPSGNLLFKQDEKSDNLYYLLSGDVDLYIDQEFVKTITDGAEHARFALNQNISCSAVAKSRVILLTIERSHVERLVILDSDKDLNNEENAGWMAQLFSSEVFAKISSANMQKMIARLDAMNVKKGDQIITQNMPGKYFYIIREGRCEVNSRNFETDEKVTLAELGVGDCFGEEALLSDQKRKTSATMLTAGSLMRLARRDFESLVQKPVLKGMNFEQASSSISQGAFWIDVRFNDEFLQSYLRNSRNIPLDQIEKEIPRLSKQQSYIMYCETGHRSSSAAAMLSNDGFDVSYLEGGIRQYSGENSMSETWVDGLSDVLRDEQETTKNLPEKQSSSVVGSKGIGEQIIAVDRRIRDLKEMLATENLIAQEWLENEHPSEDMSLLVEARKKIDHIEKIPTTIAHNKVKDEGDSDSELSQLRKQLENAQSHIQEERNRVTTDDDEGLEQKELTLSRVSDELETIKNKLKKQESFELSRRESFEHQLSTERKKMRQQLARFSTGLERQQTKSKEIEEIRHSAALETRQIIDKFKLVHEQYRLRQQKTIQAVRKQLQQQATNVINTARKAQAEKVQALASLHTVQKQLDDLRKERASLQAEDDKSATDVPMLIDIESMGDKIEQAKDKFYEANAALSLAKLAKQDNQEMLNEVMENESSVRHELVDWFTSSNQFNIDRDNLSIEQKASLERVKKIAHEALEEAFNGNHHRPDGSDDHFIKNYK